jgi:hypothetical protein
MGTKRNRQERFIAHLPPHAFFGPLLHTHPFFLHTRNEQDRPTGFSRPIVRTKKVPARSAHHPGLSMQKSYHDPSANIKN